jgi:NAD(P)-dependent dehydrogenase (short-subunit alcohol dehydrogenase family)
MWALTVPQVAATLAATLVAYDTLDAAGRRLLRLSLFYDLAKTSITRIAWALSKELAPHRCTAIALTPGWLRSEQILDNYGVGEANWRDATVKQPHFVITESPRFVGRAVAHLAADPDVARWTGQSLSSGQLAQVYGFTRPRWLAARCLALRSRSAG